MTDVAPGGQNPPPALWMSGDGGELVAAEVPPLPPIGPERAVVVDLAPTAPVEPVASRAAGAVWILAIVAMIPVLGGLAAIALLPLSSVLLAARQPLPHDRRVGKAGLVLACLSLLFALVSIVGITQAFVRASKERDPDSAAAGVVTTTHSGAPRSDPTTAPTSRHEKKNRTKPPQSPSSARQARSDATTEHRETEEMWTHRFIYLGVLFLSIVLHEIGHALSALWGGDPTARDRGRLTLNPLRHIDPVGSIILPFLLIMSHSGFWIGWAKPVPVRLNRLRHPRRGALAVTLAGVSLNLLLALVATNLLVLIGLAIRWLSPGAHLVMFRTFGHVQVEGIAFPEVWARAVDICIAAITVNIGLLGFNVLPIPPLDGFGVIRALAPRFLSGFLTKLARLGMIPLILLIALRAIDALLIPAIYATVLLLAYAGLVAGAAWPPP